MEKKIRITEHIRLLVSWDWPRFGCGFDCGLLRRWCDWPKRFYLNIAFCCLVIRLTAVLPDKPDEPEDVLDPRWFVGDESEIERTAAG